MLHGVGVSSVNDRPPSREFLVWASCDSWSRRARRKRERRDDAGSSMDPLPADSLRN